MGKFIDLTGKKFGRWLVLSKSDERTKSGNVLWTCKCDCGTEKLVSTDSLKHGYSKSCGCLSREMASRDKGPVKNLIGKKFGRFTVVELVGKRKKQYWYKCKCECGTIKEIRGQSLTQKSRPIKSCGCLRIEKLKSRLEDFTGRRFGRLKIIERVYKNIKTTDKKNPRWKAICDCGNEIIVSSNGLRCRTKSCGCLNTEVRKWRKKNLQFGENNHNWNPNLTDEDRQWNREYAVKKITKWRNEVYKRDNYICDKCGYSIPLQKII